MCEPPGIPMDRTRAAVAARIIDGDRDETGVIESDTREFVDSDPVVPVKDIDLEVRKNERVGSAARRSAMGMVEIDGYRIAYERVGAGPALVLLHGYVGDGASTWGPQLGELSDDFTVIAWDAPGAGRSSDPPDRFGMEGYANCLARFIERLGLGKPHVVGLSFGGALAIDLCRRYPAVPSTLTLVGAYAGWAGSLPSETVEQRLRQALELSEVSPEEFVDTLLPTMFSDGTPVEA